MGNGIQGTKFIGGLTLRAVQSQHKVGGVDWNISKATHYSRGPGRPIFLVNPYMPLHSVEEGDFALSYK